jgi:TolB-like protein/class 3 adenylate cyclase/Flp pilus assembly protein TadD
VPEAFKRKLTAILSADVVGYSRLMEDNEEATIQTLNTYRNSMTALVQQHRGRVVDTTGDNLMAEFSSVVDAVKCAVETQKEMNERNADLPENRRMLFRIGVNLGDIVEEDDRIYGDGVNIAARLEGLAEAGGICISRTAYDQVKNKLELGYEYLGEHSVKNISEPVHVYRILMEPEAVGKVIGERRKEKRRIISAAVIVLLIGLGGLAGWYLYIEQTKRIEPASVKEMAFPLPDKPSIAVLPFVNISGDVEQEYFVDGMADDLITDLSKISGLFVIARNSVFTYKGKAAKVDQIARELGVRYILEGSVRRAKDRVRINAQLIDATTGGHLWAERYDGKMDDVFSLQDEITQKIVAVLAVKLTKIEENQLARKETVSVAAYDAFLEGWAHYVRFRPDYFAKAIRYFKKAIELDPNYGRAYAALASVHAESRLRLWSDGLRLDGQAWTEPGVRAQIYLRKAMEYQTPLAYQVASSFSIHRRLYDKAFSEAERSIVIDPNDPNSYLAMAKVFIYTGRLVEAKSYLKKAMRLDPQYPAYYLFFLGLAQFGMDQYEEASASLERALERNPENFIALIPLAAAYAHLDRQEEAETAIEKLIETEPFMTVPIVETIFKYQYPNDEKRLLDGLEKAGLPKV